MPTPEPKEAQTAYAIQRALVEVRLEELRKALLAHERQRPLTWEHISKLGIVERRLRRLPALLGR